uniref:Inter-alpha-trypsin inhibitor heavy chain H3 n=1 Tax=Gasterosteus aculeatus aculeatus TaxID=481459 RepID=G3P4Z3_GASAC
MTFYCLFYLLQKRSTNSADMVEVHSVKVDCTVTSRFAHTVTTSKALNRANFSQEIFFEVELPKTAFIVNFSMEIDGEVYVGEVKGKEKAKKQYEQAVSSGRTAGLVKASGRTMEKFSVSVNVAAESNVTFVLTYEELLQRKLGQYEILTRLKPKQPVHEQIVTNIYEPQGIAFVEATATFLSNELLPLVEKIVTDTKARIFFSPTLEQQRKCPGCEDTLIDGDFLVKYNVKQKGGIGGNFRSIVNGYFVHYFAPPDLPRVPKNVAFVIDRSGSMSGTKIAQTRVALVAILKDLHKEDHFALILFDAKITTWKESLTKATNGNVTEAIDYIGKLKDRGVTNINGAVLRAVTMLEKERLKGNLPERSADMIILLTDGMPNRESNLEKIQENVRSAIGGKMNMFCLGFGNDVDYSFLDVMSRQNKGVARRIFEGSDAAVQLQGFYEEVASPLLLEVDLRYPDQAVGFLTKSHYSQLFNGSEIVVAGRLKDSDVDNFLVEVFALGEDFQVQGKASVVNVIYPHQQYIFGDFSERLWAYLTIQQLLENSDIGTQKEKDNVTAKALDLSLRYNFVTPLTSMVVTKPEREDGPDGPLIADKLTEGEGNALCRTCCFEVSFAVDGDPHFMIKLPERDAALCFNINDKPGTIFNLVRDPKSGFAVNGQIIGKKKVVQDGNTNTYFGRFGIVHQKLRLRLEVSTQEIFVFHEEKQIKLLWSDTDSVREMNLDFTLTKNCTLTVTLRHSVRFMVIRHTKVWRRRHDQQDYLGFYTLDSHHMSASVHGLLGQFYHGVGFEVTELRPGDVQDKPDATMYVKGQTLNVTRHWQKDFSRVENGEDIPCWYFNNDGAGLVDGRASDYIVSGIFNADF